MWVALWWLWMLLVGEWNRDEWVAAAIAATVAATLGEMARARAGVALRLPALRLLWSVPHTVVADFGLLMWALGRRKEGVFRSRPAANTWTAYVANISPNAYVVEMDDEQVLLHDLVPWRPSEEPL
jgi:hypothetical protein